MAVILEQTADRSLTVSRAAAAAFRPLGWQVTEGAATAAGTIDVAAHRLWRRDRLTARVRLAILCDAASRELVFARTAAPFADDSLASYALGDDTPPQRETIRRALEPYVDGGAAMRALHEAAYPRERSLVDAAHIAAPSARTHASGFRELDGATGFERAAGVAFRAIDALRADLLQHDLDVIVDDLTLLDDGGERAQHARNALAFHAQHAELLHAIVVTAAPLGVLANAERAADAPWLRLARVPAVGSDAQWIDIVQSDAVDRYAAQITRHYEARFARRRFAPA
jgi:hypothetical protein